MADTLGHVNVSSGAVLIIDPTYPQAGGEGGTSLGVLVHVPPGVYPVRTHEGFVRADLVLLPELPARTETVGRVPVDSGQVFFLDPTQLAFYGGGEFIPPVAAAPAPEMDAYPFDYAGACLATLSARGGGELGNQDAVAVRTAYGDGMYPVIAGYTETGDLTSLTIVFDEE